MKKVIFILGICLIGQCIISCAEDEENEIYAKNNGEYSSFYKKGGNDTIPENDTISTGKPDTGGEKGQIIIRP